MVIHPEPAHVPQTSAVRSGLMSADFAPELVIESVEVGEVNLPLGRLNDANRRLGISTMLPGTQAGHNRLRSPDFRSERAHGDFVFLKILT